MHTFSARRSISALALVLFSTIVRGDEPAENAFQKGVAAFQSGDKITAFKWFIQAAQVGHTQAAGQVGWCYESGTGVRQDLSQAANWYRKAAEKGNSRMIAVPQKLAFTAFSIGVLLAGVNCASAQTKKPTGLSTSSSNTLRSQIPEWVPVYPGSVAFSIKSNPGSIEHYFSVQLTTHDPCPKIIDWYAQKLVASGYKTFARMDHNDGGCTSSVRSDSKNVSRSIYVSASHRVSDVAISVESVERGGGGGNVGLPSWIPIYAGSKVGEVEVYTEPPSTHYHFWFSSRGDASTIYPWYESQLSRLAFKCTFETQRSAAGHFEGTAPRRTFEIHNSPTPPDNTFIVDATER